MAGSPHPQSGGNGALMRLAPVPLRYAQEPFEAVRLSGDSSRTTHGAAEAVDACRYVGALVVGALEGRAKHELLAPRFAPAGVDWQLEPLAPAIDAIAAGSFHGKADDDIASTGYVVHTLEAALWAFARTSSFREGAILAVNLGEDADTTGAVYGQLAGAYYGAEGIPEEWRAKLVKRDDIERLAAALSAAARPEHA
jgi:ADP-ribosylglycohydrolase